MSLSSCCVVQSQNEASATDADTAAEFLSKFQSKHAEVAKLVAEERLKHPDGWAVEVLVWEVMCM